MAASSIAGRWPSSPATRRCSSASSACRWRRTNDPAGATMSDTTGQAAAATEAVPKTAFDARPLVLVAVLALVAWPLVGSSSTWLTLTLAGLAMGMIVFIAASGLTLVFGLMDVLNFGHSVFIALGAFVATSVFGLLAPWTTAASVATNLAVMLFAMLAAMALGGVVGLGFERLIVRPVYGQ